MAPVATLNAISALARLGGAVLELTALAVVWASARLYLRGRGRS